MQLHSLETQFALLDDLPDDLYLPIVTHTHGKLLQRIEGILQWRTALLAGQLPEESTLVWPEKSIKRTVLMRLEALDMVQYCQEQIALTDKVLESILAAVTSAEDQANKHGAAGLFQDELAQRQKQRDRDSVFEDTETAQSPQANTAMPPVVQNNAIGNDSAASADSAKPFEQDIQYDDHQGSQPVTKPDNDNNTLQQEYSNNKNHTIKSNNASQNLKHDTHHDVSKDSSDENTVIENINNSTDNLSNKPSEDSGDSNNKATLQSLAVADYAAEHLEQEWQDLAHIWHELAEHYEGLAQYLGLGWDLTQGVLASDGWRNIIQHRKRIKHSPYLRKLVAALGRLHAYDIHKETESFSDTVMTAIKRQQEQVEEIRTPDAINDTEGIKRGDDIARMLPSELSLLGHPQLNLWWHVKRAERTLLSYQLQGVSEQIARSEQAVIEENKEENQSPEKGHGPIIICLDTSASMQGEPEQIAKALILEALRIATNEARACYVYSFGGQKQVLEHELNLTKGGFSQLLDFLQYSFTGGTDVSYALRKALNKQTELTWKTADILLLSDGRFPVYQRLEQKISTFKKHRDVRIHGVLLGHWQGQAMQNICNPLHRFSDIIV